MSCPIVLVLVVEMSARVSKARTRKKRVALKRGATKAIFPYRDEISSEALSV
ncbi:MAG: hypothetical protein HYU36_04665 [Planctomycetes bacterium]|nr:hypothetical protein [Planctomycetota bacterium]